MPWDPTPWFVGGGAQHSPDVARMLPFAAFGGGEGVVGHSSLRVEEYAVPGAGVRVLTGMAVLRDRSTGGEFQAYLGRLPTEDTVDIAATGSTVGRSDLIIARVENPHEAGEPWPMPADVTVGPYIATRVLAGVPAGTTSVRAVRPTDTAITLARVDLPASTATITQAMITDLREMAWQRSMPLARSASPAQAEALTTTSYSPWPNVASWTIAVPDWATAAVISAMFGGIDIPTGNVWGSLRVSLGGQTSEATTYNESVQHGFHDRRAMVLSDEMTIPASVRGTNATLRTEGLRSGGTGGVNVSAVPSSSVAVNVTFLERPT